MSLGEVVRAAARRFGDAAALTTPAGWSLSYAGLDRLSDEVAAGLHRRGVVRGSVLALVLPSGPEYLVAYAAASKLGAATAGVNPGLAERERGGLCALAEPTLVLATRPLAAGLPGTATVEEVHPAAHPEGILAALRAGHPTAAGSPVGPDPRDLAAVVFTSGTTGTPRAAEFTVGQLAAIAAMEVGDRWGGGPPMLVSTQFAHVGFMTKLPWYLRLGGTMHLLQRWRADDAIATIARHRIPSLGGVAPQLALILRSPALAEHDLSCLRTIVMGGAPSPPSLVDAARTTLGAAYSIRYSSTESGGVGTATAFDADDEEARHTVGRPRPGVEVRVADEDGRDLPDGEVGEVLLRSPAVMRGYRGDPAATAAALRDGWLHTGDLGVLDDRGLLRLRGRTGDTYIRGGYNVHPQEVEAALGTHPGVAEVAVVPRPDAVMGEIGVAVVVPTSGAEAPTLESLRAHLDDRLAPWKLPEAVRIVGELPRTPMAKVDRRRLVDAEAAGSAAR